MNYSTQMDAAKKGIVTPQMRDVMANEKISETDLLERVAKGEISIPANKNHTNLKGIGVGHGLRTKINVNLGVSEDCHNIEAEMVKVNLALDLKTDAIMDLSTYGLTREFRKKVIETSPVMIGTVPIYDAVVSTGKDIKDITVDEWFETVETHGKDGVDFITIHAGLNRNCMERLKNNARLTHVVSRGGAIMIEWMVRNTAENPFFEHYDRLLEICRRYDMTISLGDGLRPGSLHDATDAAQIQELIIIGELTKRAWAKDVQIMVEGPGHIPLHEITANMLIQKKLCYNAPFYVLGPLVTDIAPGYDHITSAIGGALAAASGADFLCYVTPAEHLRLPDLDDMKEGIMACRIAAHAGDIAKGISGAIDLDHAMSQARINLDWNEMYRLAIDPGKAKKYRESVPTKDDKTCSMCGNLCSMKRSKRVLEEEMV